MLPAGRGRVRAPAARAAGEHQELDAADAEHRRGRALMRLDAQAQEILIEAVRTGAVRAEDRAVAPAAQRDQAFLRRRLRGGAHVAERAASAAVPRILQLHHDAVGIAEIQLRRALARAARVRAAHAHAHLHRPAAQAAAAGVSRLVRPRDAALAERSRDPVHVEIVHAQADVVDVRPAGPRGAHAEELRARADLQVRRHALAADHGHAEQALVEVHRPLDVRHRQRDVVDPADADWRSLREGSRRERHHRQRRQRLQQAPPRQHLI